MLKFLILFLAAASTAHAGTVISLEKFRARKGCDDLLTRFPKSAALTHLSGGSPDYIEPQAFLAEMSSKPLHAVYLFAEGSLQYGIWTQNPLLPRSRELFILKTYRPLTSFDYSSGWSTEQVVKIFRTVSFTRITISPLFALFHDTLHFIRGIETRLDQSEYASPNVDLQFLWSPEHSLRFRLRRFIDSWEPRTERELELRQLLDLTVDRHVKTGEREPDRELMLRAIREVLKDRYKPEDLDRWQAYLTGSAAI